MSLDRRTKWTAVIATVVIAVGAGYTALDSDSTESRSEADSPAAVAETTLLDQDAVPDPVNGSSAEQPTSADGAGTPPDVPTDPSGPGGTGPGTPGSADPGDPVDPAGGSPVRDPRCPEARPNTRRVSGRFSR